MNWKASEIYIGFAPLLCLILLVFATNKYRSGSQEREALKKKIESLKGTIEYKESEIWVLLSQDSLLMMQLIQSRQENLDTNSVNYKAYVYYDALVKTHHFETPITFNDFRTRRWTWDELHQCFTSLEDDALDSGKKFISFHEFLAEIYDFKTLDFSLLL